ncbi:hypothetical protein BJ165DRAFT_1115553 [Panaeolus papilionaceus]|nr:hypothetical protein BJ165DRAFT_1115553 [Panaeolus papilionaceus]
MLSSFSGLSSWGSQRQVQRQVQQQHQRGSMRRQSQAMGTQDIRVHVQQVQSGVTIQDIVKGAEGDDKSHGNVTWFACIFGDWVLTFSSFIFLCRFSLVWYDTGIAEAPDVDEGVAVQVYPGSFAEVWIEEGEGGEGLSGLFASFRLPAFYVSCSPILLGLANVVKCLFPVLQLGFLFYNGKFISVLSPRVTLIFVATAWTFGLYLSTSLIPSTPIYFL